MTQKDDLVTAADLHHDVEEAVQRTPVFDIHTHLYPPASKTCPCGESMSW